MDKASGKAIDAIAKASTIDGLCFALRRCLRVLECGPGNRAEFAEALKAAFHSKSEECRRRSDLYIPAGVCAANVHVYCDLPASLIFAAFRICMSRDADELFRQVEFVADFFGSCLTRPRSGVLTGTEVCGLLGLVQEKYGLLAAVTCDRELEVYLINRSHIRYDSFLLTYKNTHTGIWLNKWLVFSLSPCLDAPECNKYHVFLHEMGHILYNAVTGGGEAVPELFGEIAFVLGIPAGRDMNCPDELFADLFSASALYGSGYSSFNPFGKLLSREVYELLGLYFRMLAGNVEKGNYGSGSVSGVLH